MRNSIYSQTIGLFILLIFLSGQGQAQNACDAKQVENLTNKLAKIENTLKKYEDQNRLSAVRVVNKLQELRAKTKARLNEVSSACLTNNEAIPE